MEGKFSGQDNKTNYVAMLTINKKAVFSHRNPKLPYETHSICYYHNIFVI